MAEVRYKFRYTVELDIEGDDWRDDEEAALNRLMERTHVTDQSVRCYGLGDDDDLDASRVDKRIRYLEERFPAALKLLTARMFCFEGSHAGRGEFIRQTSRTVVADRTEEGFTKSLAEERNRIKECERDSRFADRANYIDGLRRAATELLKDKEALNKANVGRKVQGDRFKQLSNPAQQVTRNCTKYDIDFQKLMDAAKIHFDYLAASEAKANNKK